MFDFIFKLMNFKFGFSEDSNFGIYSADLTMEN